MSSKNTKDSSIQEAFIILKISQIGKNRLEMVSSWPIFEAQMVIFVENFGLINLKSHFS